MISFDNIPKVYLVHGATDLRKGIDGYASIIQGRCELTPYQDALFLFVNRSHNKLKMLYYDGNGFWLLYKRLESGTFKWLKSNDSNSVEISKQQLQWLLDGIDIVQKRAFKERHYKYT